LTIIITYKLNAQVVFIEVDQTGERKFDESVFLTGINTLEHNVQYILQNDRYPIYPFKDDTIYIAFNFKNKRPQELIVSIHTGKFYYRDLELALLNQNSRNISYSSDGYINDRFWLIDTRNQHIIVTLFRELRDLFAFKDSPKILINNADEFFQNILVLTKKRDGKIVCFNYVSVFDYDYLNLDLLPLEIVYLRKHYSKFYHVDIVKEMDYLVLIQDIDFWDYIMEK
jgi:hypothetical protein